VFLCGGAQNDWDSFFHFGLDDDRIIYFSLLPVFFFYSALLAKKSFQIRHPFSKICGAKKHNLVLESEAEKKKATHLQ
jgi:hypothetical protein